MAGFCILVFFLVFTSPVIAGGREEKQSGPDNKTFEDQSESNRSVLQNTGSLTVNAAAQAAVENSVELDLEQLKLQEHAAAIKEARAATGPTIDLQTSGSLLSNPQEGYTISKGAFGYAPSLQSPAPTALPDRDYVVIEDAEHTYFRVSARLSQPLFTWGKIEKAISLANLSFDVASQQYLGVERNVEKQARLAYFGAVFAKRSADMLSEADTIAGQILKDKENAFEAGMITRQEVLDAAATKAALSARLSKMVEAGKTVVFTLSQLTGLDLEEIRFASNYRSKPLSVSEDHIIHLAREASHKRAELAKRIDQAAALVDIEVASGPYRPDLALNLTVDVTGQKIPVLGANWTKSWDTNVILTLGTQTTLFDSGASKSKIEQAKVSLETAREGLRGFDTSLELQIRSLLETAHTAWADVTQLEAELELVREIERNAVVSFENDLITRAELQSAKLSSLAAGLQYERALFTHETALIELETLIR